MKKIINYIAFAVLFWATACSQTEKSNTTETSTTTPKDSATTAMAKETAKAKTHTADQGHAKMMQILGKPKHYIKTLGIVVYDGVNELDLMGPRYILGQMMGVKTQLIGMKPGNIKTVMGVEIVPNTIIDSVDQLDILVIPGGAAGTIKGAYDQKLLAWIKKIDQNTTYTAGVCTGSWILGASGLLKDKNATTNWYRAKEMMERYGAKFQQRRYVNDGKYWTSAGVTAGMDMSLAILNDIWGETYTQAVMLDMEYNPAPPIKGGVPATTKPGVLQMMTTMYDMGVQPLIDSLDQVQKAKNK